MEVHRSRIVSLVCVYYGAAEMNSTAVIVKIWSAIRRPQIDHYVF